MAAPAAPHATVPDVPILDLPLSTRVSQAPAGFAMVAFTGAHAPVRFRVSTDGLRWSRWQEADLLAPEDEGPDPGSPEALATPAGATEPIWVGPTRWLEVAGDLPITAHLLDPLELTRSLTDRALDAVRSVWQGSSALAEPLIVSRRDWGADESWRGPPSYTDDLRGAVVHHTAGTNGYRPEHAAAIVRGIYAYHTRTLGWKDIGYHLLVDRFGRIYEGRAGGLERQVVGAHTGGFNRQTFGVAVLGSHGDQPPPPAATESLARALAWKLSHHDLPAEGTVELLSRGSSRHPAGTRVEVERISGHRDLSRTACPGEALYAQLPRIRQRASELLPGESDPVLPRLLPSLIPGG